MAVDSSIGLLWRKSCEHSTCSYKISDGFEIQQDTTRECGELAALDRLKKIPIDWEKCCDHSSEFILGRSSSFLQVTRTTIKAWLSLNFSQNPSPATELAALSV